jgi:SAM-dependent methyltransferase
MIDAALAALDADYCATHALRFERTFAHAHRAGSKPGVLLDIGAHWLQQASLWCAHGWRVIAADLPTTLTDPTLIGHADRLGIERLIYRDLSAPDAFAALRDSSIDCVLFCEILEHLSFNPVALWREIYRVLKPGGRIVLTTPNYYALNARAWSLGRFWRGDGGGLTVAEILTLHTYAHHWKEYSRRELVGYFCALSRDFHVHVEPFDCWPNTRRKLRIDLWRRGLIRLAPGLSNMLYAELTLTQKHAGITIQTRWDAPRRRN